MVALSLVRDHGNRLASTQSLGWLKRAGRLLHDEPDSSEHVYLEMMRARDRTRADGNDETAMLELRSARSSLEKLGAAESGPREAPTHELVSV